MASYQDIESRLRSVEEKLDWVMKQFTVQKREILPTLDPSGRPLVKVTTKSLLDLYFDIKTGSLEVVQDPTDPSNDPSKEIANVSASGADANF